MTPRNFDGQEIATKWQTRWENDQLYKVDGNSDREKWRIAIAHLLIGAMHARQRWHVSK